MSIVAHDKLVESGEKNKFLLCILMTPLKKKQIVAWGKVIVKSLIEWSIFNTCDFLKNDK